MSQGPKVKGVADVVFLVDVTGSMQPCIDGLRANIAAFVQRCRQPDENGGVPIRDLRISVCGYRDYPHSQKVPTDPWFEHGPFEVVGDSVAPLQAALAKLQARGGGDEPESLLDALFKVASFGESSLQDAPDAMKWRPGVRRVVVAFTDATFHPSISAEEGRGGDYTSVGQVFTGSKLKLIVYAPRHECYDNLGAIDGSVIEFYTDDIKSAQRDLQAFTSNQESFRKTLEMLAKTVTVEAGPISL